jgi:hypothetical protein
MVHQHYHTFDMSEAEQVVSAEKAGLSQRRGKIKQLQRGISRGKSVWKSAKAGEVTLAQEQLFLHMQLRKMDRSLTGTKSRNTSYEFVVLAVFLILIYSAGSVTSEQNLNSDAFVSLSFAHVILIGVWLFVAVMITSIFKESKFIELMYWMLIYLPFLAVIADFVFYREIENELGPVVAVFLIVAETMAVLIFFSIYWLYPHVLNSAWFRRNKRVSFFFGVKAVADWTMTYTRKKSRCGLGKRHTCKYSGAVNKKGEPHGLGRWFDDARDGEVLTGSWRNGIPIAPFVSRVYGNGDAFRCVKLAYIKASDDEFASTKWWPTDEQPMMVGMASVECSVSGSFYNDLPRTENVFEPYVYDPATSVQEVLDNLPLMREEKSIQKLEIRSDDPRGIQVSNHVFVDTGRAFQKVDKITLTIEKVAIDNSHESKLREFMPISPDFGTGNIMIREAEIEDGSKEEDSSSKENMTGDVDIEEGTKLSREECTLQVKNWAPVMQKDVLVFVPGFNCSLKNALDNFGQLIAMTKMDSHVHPILFNWPAGQVLTYHSATRAALSEKNFQNFCQFFKGLQNAGVRNVHLMSHSMGVLTLVGSMVDKNDGSRSDCSLCFQLTPDCDDTTPPEDRNEAGEQLEEKRLLLCRTITLLNPDFPLIPFQEHAFCSIRRICKTITVVGDKNDGALFWSQTVNGIAVRYGYRQPDAILPNDSNKMQLKQLLTVGKCISSLYFPEDVASQRNIIEHDYLIFKDDAPLLLRGTEDQVQEKYWMDLGTLTYVSLISITKKCTLPLKFLNFRATDVIDTTGLDTNIADIRHSAYNLNPSLLRDLEELVSTGKRAMDRSLLYREGNIFSYCNAPSYVSM